MPEQLDCIVFRVIVIPQPQYIFQSLMTYLLVGCFIYESNTESNNIFRCLGIVSEGCCNKEQLGASSLYT